MGSKLAKILAPLLISTTLLFSGCEEEETQRNETITPINIGNERETGTLDVYGLWYKKEEGTTRDGWKWHWANLQLSQKNEELSGMYTFERYGSNRMNGWINGNQIYLENRFGTNVYSTLQGKVTEDGTRMDLTHHHLSSEIKRKLHFRKISTSFEDFHDPMK